MPVLPLCGDPRAKFCDARADEPAMCMLGGLRTRRVTARVPAYPADAYL